MENQIDQRKLYGRKELAGELGVSLWFIRRMIALGFKMPLGRASLKMAHDFMEKNAEELTKSSPSQPHQRP